MRNIGLNRTIANFFKSGRWIARATGDLFNLGVFIVLSHQNY